MTIHVATSLIAFVSYGGLLALAVRSRRPGHRPRQLFVLYLLDMLLLQVAYLVLSLAATEREALLGYQFNVPLSMGQVVIYFLFTRSFLELVWPRRLIQAVLAMWMALVAAGVFLVPQFFFADIYRDQATGLFVPEFGASATMLLAPVLVLLGIIVRDLVRGYRTTRSPLQRVRTHYLLLAIVIVWAGMLANAAPSIRPYPVDVMANIVSAGLIAYAILRYQLLDIHVVVRRWLGHVVLALMMGVGYLGVVLAASLGHLWEDSQPLLLYFAIAIGVAILVSPLRDRTLRWTERVLFKENYDSGLMLQRLSRTAASILDLERLAGTILDDVVGTLHVRWAALLLEQADAFRPSAQKGPEADSAWSLSREHPVAQWLASRAAVMTTDTLNELRAHGALTRLQLDELERLGVELLIPLTARDRLVGILALGTRLSSRGYSQDDERTLTILAHQVAIAVDNARLYEQVQQELAERKRVESERVALITELNAKNTELEQFTYTVSHDLRSPLITLRGFMGFLEKDVLAGNVERARADMARITEATDKMQRLLTELLELSRIGRMMNPPQAISFEAIAREAVDLVRGRIEARGVRVDIAPDLPTVYGDRTRLIQVAQNLVDNACKFMGDQPEPRIEIGCRGTDADGPPVLFVRDNGLGIEPHQRERVFGLFNKLDAQSEGTGVGLALVKRIVEVHGGKIWVESEGAGQGATFCFTLPIPPAG